MARLRYNGLTATLGADLLTAGTTITFAAALTSAAGAVPTISGTDYIPLTILDADGNVAEIVHLTAYTEGGTGPFAVTRAQESTTAADHAEGSTVIHGPTVADHMRRDTTLGDLLTGQRFLIAAHRGDIGSDDSYPENSLEAVRQAAHKGCELVEVDLWQSTDGTFWLNHDSTVDRTTGGTGTVTAMSDAALAALAYDAGHGYDVGRHGSTIGLATLAEVLDALEPYGCGLFAQFQGGDVSDLAQQIVDAGWGPRVVIEVSSLADAATVKAVDPALAVMANVTLAGASTSDDVDWLSHDVDNLTDLATIQGYAPKMVKAYTSINDIGTDETTRYANAYDYGARAFQAHDIEMALAARDGGGGVESVVAGTGIAVDSTDPANPVVSATGGADPTLVGCRAKKSTAQAAAQWAAVTVAFDGADDYDTDGLHDPATNNSRITVDRAGVWRFTTSVLWASHATVALRGIVFAVNGSGISGSEGGFRWNSVTGTSCYGTTTTDLLLAAGDYVEVVATQGSAATLDIQTATFSAHFLGAP